MSTEEKKKNIIDAINKDLFSYAIVMLKDMIFKNELEEKEKNHPELSNSIITENGWLLLRGGFYSPGQINNHNS